MTLKEKALHTIKALGELSIPELQYVLDVDYITARRIITGLEQDKLLTFLKGVTYRYVEPPVEEKKAYSPFSGRYSSRRNAQRRHFIEDTDKENEICLRDYPAPDGVDILDWIKKLLLDLENGILAPKTAVKEDEDAKKDEGKNEKKPIFSFSDFLQARTENDDDDNDDDDDSDDDSFDLSWLDVEDDDDDDEDDDNELEEAKRRIEEILKELEDIKKDDKDDDDDDDDNDDSDDDSDDDSKDEDDKDIDDFFEDGVTSDTATDEQREQAVSKWVKYRLGKYSESDLRDKRVSPIAVRRAATPIVRALEKGFIALYSDGVFNINPIGTMTPLAFMTNLEDKWYLSDNHTTLNILKKRVDIGDDRVSNRINAILAKYHCLLVEGEIISCDPLDKNTAIDQLLTFAAVIRQIKDIDETNYFALVSEDMQERIKGIMRDLVILNSESSRTELIEIGMSNIALEKSAPNPDRIVLFCYEAAVDFLKKSDDDAFLEFKRTIIPF